MTNNLTSKFQMPTPVTKRGSGGTEREILTNIIPLVPIDADRSIHVYTIRFDEVQLRDEREKAVDAQAESFDSEYLYDGDILYLNKKLTQTRFPAEGAEVETVPFKASYCYERKISECPSFLKCVINLIPRFLDQKPLFRLFIDPAFREDILNSDIEIYGATRIRLSQAEVYPSVLIDRVHCLKRRTIQKRYDMLPNVHQKLSIVRDECVGKVAIDHANNTVFTISDVRTNEEDSNDLVVTASTVHCVDDRTCVTVFYNSRPCSVFSARSLSLLVNRNGLNPLLSEKRNIEQCIRVTPDLRLKAIQLFCTKILKCPGAVDMLKKWNLALTPASDYSATLSLQARELDFPSIHIGSEPKIMRAECRFWDVKTELPRCYPSERNVVRFDNWAVVCHRSNDKLGERLIQSICLYAPRIGVPTSRGSLKIVCSDSTQDVSEAFLEKVHDVAISSNGSLQFIIVILPNGNPTELRQIYVKVKKVCMCLPLASQMVNIRTIQPKPEGSKSNTKISEAVIGGLVTGIYTKLGHAWWSVDLPLRENVMFVGLDVSHSPIPTEGSVGAMVCSLNTNLTKFYSSTMSHGHRQEIFDSIRGAFSLALKAFVEENEQLPDRIMVYRDGVHKTMYQTVLQHELEQFFAAIDKAYVTRPFISLIVVQKRVYERLFYWNSNGNSPSSLSSYKTSSSGRYENAPVGTVIDHTVTRKNYYDFFLNSMYKPNQRGTSIPAHYVMIYDNSNLTPDMFHKVTFALCFAYLNWPGSFFIPAIVKYADKLAGFALKCNMLPPPMVSRKLHFL